MSLSRMMDATHLGGTVGIFMRAYCNCEGPGANVFLLQSQNAGHVHKVSGWTTLFIHSLTHACTVCQTRLSITCESLSICRYMYVCTHAHMYIRICRYHIHGGAAGIFIWPACGACTSPPLRCTASTADADIAGPSSPSKQIQRLLPYVPVHELRRSEQARILVSVA